MSNYQRSISYLDYLENGMKIRNAGFVKTEENSGQMRLEVRMKNLPDKFSGQYDLHADSGGVVGTISLNRGNGSCCIVWKQAEAADQLGVEAGGIYLRLPDRCLVQTVWPVSIRIPLRQTDNDVTQMLPEKEALPAAQQEMPVQQEAPAGLQSVPMQQGVPAEPQDEPEMVEEMPLSPECFPTLEKQIPVQEVQNEKRMEIQQKEHYYSDKWEQLLHMYPQIHPFEDERTYLSITPKDFVVLCRDYQKMVHNSFLLHGFYNYHHLLLGKIEEKGEWHYYLGVPGNFYTREKMVAEMFGFEAFEGEKNPASPGDFGYYMKRVEI